MKKNQSDIDMEFIGAYLSGETVDEFIKKGGVSSWKRDLPYKSKYSYEISEEDRSVCRSFAELVNPHTYPIYKKRHKKLTYEECLDNHYTGKLAEIAGINYLRHKGFSCDDPDFSLHYKRSYDSDTKATHPKQEGRVFNVHIKSQTESLMRFTRNTPSYAFTIGDELIERPHFDDFVLMTIIHKDDVGQNCKIDIVDMQKATMIFPHFVKPLVLPSKQRVAIYYSDIQKALKVQS